MLSQIFTNPANLLTVSRLLALPLVWVGMVLYTPQSLVMALIITIIAELTDVADGYVARRFKLKSDLGGLLDPLADSVFHLGIFTALAMVGVVPIWLLFILAGRDIVVGYCRMLARGSGNSGHARLPGKLKTITHGVVVVVLIASAAFNITLPVFWLVAAVIVTTLWSAADHVKVALKAL